MNSSSAMVSDVRTRCLDEVSDEGAVTALAICQDDCELSDDTPLGLILSGSDCSLECIVGEVSKLNSLQLYIKKARGTMIFCRRLFLSFSFFDMISQIFQKLLCDQRFLCFLIFFCR